VRERERVLRGRGAWEGEGALPCSGRRAYVVELGGRGAQEEEEAPSGFRGRGSAVGIKEEGFRMDRNELPRGGKP